MRGVVSLCRRFPPRLRLAGLVALPIVISAALSAEEPAAPPAVKQVPSDHAERAKAGLKLFRETVGPLLTANCLDCHGGKAVKADFNLATRELLIDSGQVDATAADSYLMALIRHEEEPHMPYKQPKLSDEAIAAIGKWIDLGAPYDKPLAEPVSEAAGPESHIRKISDSDRKFWSFLPLSTAEPPAVKNEAWVRTPIDRFILSRQEGAGLHPNRPADRRALIRRAYFDLLGLPPTPDEIDAFVADRDPAAYEKLIDRLLESPHYGERWARHWMDVARFAESFGYEQDYDRPHAYHYRDFLIKAFNADMPYDQFLRWQLAGDELAPDDPLAMTATGFIGGGAFPTQLTEAEFESARYDELDDVVGTLGVSMLGLSIGCARCHDHKFDPIGNWDYYRMAATFTTTIRSEIDLDMQPAKNEKIRGEFAIQLKQKQTALARYEQETLRGAFRAFLASYDAAASDSASAWRVLEVASVESSGGSQFENQGDGSWLAVGEAPLKETLVVKATAPVARLAGLRIEALADDSLPHHGPGRAGNGNFALGDIRVTVQTGGDGDAKAKQAKLVNPRATHQQNADVLSIAASIDDDPISGWAVDLGGIGKNQAAAFDVAEPIELSPGAEITVTLSFNHPNTRHAIGRFQLSAAELTGAPADGGKFDPLADARELLLSAKNADDETSAAWQKGMQRFAQVQPEWQKLSQEIAALEKAGPQVKTEKVQVSSEGLPHMPHHADGRGFPHFYPETHFLNRGDVHQKQEVVETGYLRVLERDGKEASFWRVEPPSGWTRTSYRRASLANWITDVDYGAGELAARVIVNRLWQHHFGRGIVATPSDFGFSGERPTHPALLDWMARYLITPEAEGGAGWRLKRLHKLMMTSGVYLQSTQSDEQRATIDRENALLWRRTPQRLEAEPIRDAMLSAAGMLDDTMYGPGTLDPDMRRRSVYFFIKRSQLIPTMMLFDWPEHLVSIGQRSSTTTAPQALMFMNSPQGREYATGLARRMNEAAEPGGETDQAQKLAAIVRRGFRLAYGRLPTESEVAASVEFIHTQAESYQEADKENAVNQAIVDLAQALLSANEFIYVE